MCPREHYEVTAKRARGEPALGHAARLLRVGRVGGRL